MKIVHISDLHHEHHKTVDELIDSIRKHYKGLDEKPIVVLTGDLVHSSMNKRKMRDVKGILKRLIKDGFDLLICPGNHDLKILGVAGKPRKKLYVFNKYFKSLLPEGRNYNGEDDNDLLDYPTIHQYDNHFFIGLNSMEEDAEKARGRLGDDQIAELNEAISSIREEHNDPKIIVYLHHYPFKFGYNFDSLKLEDEAALMDTIKGVNILLFGHWHARYDYADQEREFNINRINIGGYCTYKGALHWYEIDTETYQQKVLP